MRMYIKDVKKRITLYGGTVIKLDKAKPVGRGMDSIVYALPGDDSKVVIFTFDSYKTHVWGYNGLNRMHDRGEYEIDLYCRKNLVAKRRKFMIYVLVVDRLEQPTGANRRRVREITRKLGPVVGAVPYNKNPHTRARGKYSALYDALFPTEHESNTRTSKKYPEVVALFHIIYDWMGQDAIPDFHAGQFLVDPKTDKLIAVDCWRDPECGKHNFIERMYNGYWPGERTW